MALGPKGVAENLTPEQDTEGIRSFSDVPSTMVFEKTFDIVGARVHADVASASRRCMKETRKALGDDFKGQSKAC